MGPHPERYKNLSWHGTDIMVSVRIILVSAEDFCLESLSMMRSSRDRYPHDECDRTGVLIVTFIKCFPGHCVHREQW